MNRHSTAEADVEMAIQHEAVKRIRSAFDKICEEYETKLNRKPTNEEIDTIIKAALANVMGGQLFDQQEGNAAQPANEGDCGGTGHSCMAEKPCTCKIPTFEAATSVAGEIVKGNRHCRFISGEMRVENDGETISLMEEQVLSDGTRILGRSFSFDSSDEAIEAVAKMLWESAKSQGEASVVIRSESQESNVC
jgi:hypothetical protein